MGRQSAGGAGANRVFMGGVFNWVRIATDLNMDMLDTRGAVAPERIAEAPVRPPDPLRDALIDSRQRWRDLVTIATDLAFETDAGGRLVFLSPSSVMGWPAHALLGHTGDVLLPDAEAMGVCNPFRATEPLRNKRVWLKRPDGNLCWMSFSVVPLLDAAGAITGVRGVAKDVSEFDRAEAAMAQALRRSELIDHIVWHMRTEIMAPRMMGKALTALIRTLGADGAMIVDGSTLPDLPPDLDRDPTQPAGLLHSVGENLAVVREMAIARLREGFSGPGALRSSEGHGCLLCATPTRFDGCPGLVVWRLPDGRSWDADDLALLSACIGTLRVVLEHGAIQQEMARQARTDSLTGLFNRRAFREEMARRLARLERDNLPGSLMFVDLDRFKTLNDRMGHEAGDEALREVARLLRSVTRPGDLVARLGGDEFAVWFDGMDDLATAERAEHLRRHAPLVLSDLAKGEVNLSMSIGIATRWAGSDVEVGTLLRRADAAMYQVKRAGRGQWRVWHGEQDDHV